MKWNKIIRPILIAFCAALLIFLELSRRTQEGQRLHFTGRFATAILLLVAAFLFLIWPESKNF